MKALVRIIATIIYQLLNMIGMAFSLGMLIGIIIYYHIEQLYLWASVVVGKPKENQATQ